MFSPDPRNCSGKILEREISALTLAGEVLLDAVVSAQADGSSAWLFFKSGTPRSAAALPSEERAVVHNYGGAPVLEAPAGAAAVTVTVHGEPYSIPLNPDETHLFEDLNVLAAVRNGETAGTAADWLRYHVSQHGMQAAVIFDRAPPQDSRRFIKALEGHAAGIAGLQRVVVVHSRLPLGREGLPEEAHPFNVPGAPGKDRMEIPPSGSLAGTAG